MSERDENSDYLSVDVPYKSPFAQLCTRISLVLSSTLVYSIRHPLEHEQSAKEQQYCHQYRLLYQLHQSSHEAPANKIKTRHSTRVMDNLIEAFLPRKALLSNQAESDPITPQTTRRKYTLFPAEILMEICSYLAPSLSDDRTERALKQTSRRSLSLASKQCHEAVHPHRFRVLDLTRHGSQNPYAVLSKLISQPGPEQAQQVRELAIRDASRRCMPLMPQIHYQIGSLAVPATLKHDLLHNTQYWGSLLEYTILLSVSNRLEILWLDFDQFTLGRGLRNIFQEAARPELTLLPCLREVNVKMEKALPTEQMQDILRLPALQTFECHGYICTIRRTRQDTGPRDILSIHVEQHSGIDSHWVQRLLLACPHLEDLSMETYTNGHGAHFYTTMGETLRTYGQQLRHLKLENRCKSGIEEACGDKMEALGGLEPLERLQTLSACCRSEVEGSRPRCWNHERVY